MSRSALALVRLLLIITLASLPVMAQSDDDGDAVVRVTTSLVQIDVVVTDKNGRQVTDLKPEDFELFEDNRRQALTNFSYILAPVARQQGLSRPNITSSVPPARLRPEQVRRTIAFVIDDLGLSFESVNILREALKKFVAEKMVAGDLVAIVRTSGGTGALQQFTADKRQLLATIERVQWRPFGRGGISVYEPLDYSIPGTVNRDKKKDSKPGGNKQEVDSVRDQYFSVGTLGALNSIIGGLRDIPGRKALVLVSDGFPLADSRTDREGVGQGRANSLRAFLNRLIDQANRAAAIIYTVDARALQPLNITAADNLRGTNANAQDLVLSNLDDRREKQVQLEEGLKFLSDQTGGRFSNDLGEGINAMLDDQNGYYLLGYDPEESSFSPQPDKFRNITVKVKRPGLRARARKGFLAGTDEGRPASRQIADALISPFAAGDLRLRLTALFNHMQNEGSYLRALLHIDADNLTFTREDGDWQRGVFDIVAVTLGESGAIIDEVSRTHTIRLRGEARARVQAEGFAYIVDLPVKKAGAYQLRAVVRDTASGRLGSASQFVAVPDISKGRLALSGIFLAHHDAHAQEDDEARALVAAARKFRSGQAIDYYWNIFNARGARGKLMAQVRLFRNGEPVFTGQAQAIDAVEKEGKITSIGRLQLGKELVPGEYYLQLIVSDHGAGGNSAVQWIDFELR